MCYFCHNNHQMKNYQMHPKYGKSFQTKIVIIIIIIRSKWVRISQYEK